MFDNYQLAVGSVPKYRQLLQILRNRILSGEFVAGAQLPTVEELGQGYGVSRGTVRKAIQQLEAERLIRTEQGLGTFVATLHPNTVPFHFTLAIGGGDVVDTNHLSHRTLVQEVIPASMEIAERLHLPLGSPVIHVDRLSTYDGQFVARTGRYLPEDLCPELLDQNLSHAVSIHDLLVSHSELPLLRAEIEIEAHMLTEDEARVLEAPAGSAVVLVDRLTYTAPNRPAVWFRGYYRNAYQLGVHIGDVDTLSPEREDHG